MLILDLTIFFYLSILAVIILFLYIDIVDSMLLEHIIKLIWEYNPNIILNILMKGSYGIEYRLLSLTKKNEFLLLELIK